MIGIIDRGQVFALVILGAREPTEMRSHRFDVENLDRPFVPCLAIFVPNVVERYPIDLIAIIAERVDVTVADFAPVDELDAQFETSLHSRQHFAFVNFEQFVEIKKRGNGSFADANRANFLGFNERNRHFPARNKPRERRSGHPTGGAAPHYYDIIYRHCARPLAICIATFRRSANCERSFWLL